jgi:hypothetical protein
LVWPSFLHSLFSNDKNNSEGRWPTFPVGHPLSEFTETLGHDPLLQKISGASR